MKFISLIKGLLVPSVLVSNIVMLSAQWSGEIDLNVDINQGYLWPRIVETELGACVTWGNGATKDIYSITIEHGNKGSATLLNDGFEPAFTTGWASTEIASYQGQVGIIYKSDNAETGSTFLLFSNDNGQSFTGPLEVINGNDITHRFPAIAMDNDGIYISYMRFQQGFLDPQYDLIHFEDESLMMSETVSVSENLTGEVCDCCVSNILTDEDEVVVLFRNNNSNFRDIHAGFANKSDLEFESITDLDSGSWRIFSCPSTGADALISGNNLISVYMSGQEVAGTLYLSEVDMITKELINERKLITDPSTMINMNFPRLAGNGDTLGVVWQASQDRSLNVYFSYSVDGTSVLGDTVIQLASDPSGTQINPDIAFRNGVFHITWQDNSTAHVKYKTFSLKETTTSADIEYPEYHITGIENGKHIVLNSTKDVKNIYLITPSGQVDETHINGRKISIQALSSSVYHLLIKLENGQSITLPFVIAE